jgi:hypothetical protein
MRRHNGSGKDFGGASQSFKKLILLVVYSNHAKNLETAPVVLF